MHGAEKLERKMRGQCREKVEEVVVVETDRLH